MKILSVGSGKIAGRENVIRLDIAKDTGADVIWDLNLLPYPFAENEFDRIECYDVIEHVNDIPKVMQECHRILKKGGDFHITTPHYSSPNSYIDPTHKFHLSYYSFDCFSDEHKYSYYSGARFKIEERQLMFHGSKIRKFLLTRLANRFPKFYEEHLAWIFPAWFLYFRLTKV